VQYVTVTVNVFLFISRFTLLKIHIFFLSQTMYLCMWTSENVETMLGLLLEFVAIGPIHQEVVSAIM
jgi:hypothetical protein